jgi:hypothetical protein
MAMAMDARAVPLGAAIFAARFPMLLKERGDFRFVRAFGRLGHRRPQDANSGAQRDEL